MHIFRPAAVVIGAVATLALTMGPASAHFCYNANAVEEGMAGMGSSNGFVTFYEVAKEFTGLCDDGIQVLADAAGVTFDTALNAHTVMAGGSGGKSKGINHLDFAAIEAAFPEAVEACS